MWDPTSLYQQSLSSQINGPAKYKLYDLAKSNKCLVQKLDLERKLSVHKGCVNTICWSDCGRFILSGSDDQRLSISDSYANKVVHDIQTGHRANIFCAKFLPNTNNRHVVSCSGDGVIIFSDIEQPETSMYNVFNCHYGTAYELTTVPNDSHTFLSCGEDGTVRWFDLRTKQHCCQSDCKDDILINCRYAVTALAVNHLTPYLLAIGCADSNVRIFDRRMLGTRALGNYAGSGVQSVVTRFTVPEFENKHRRITSLCYSPDAREMLVSYSSDYIYLFDTRDSNPVAKLLPSGAKKSLSAKSVRRLRVRGDWSDTGPNARPETERHVADVPMEAEEAEPSANHPTNRPNLMQRMSEVLTRIFNSPSGTSGSERPEGSGVAIEAADSSPAAAAAPLPVVAISPAEATGSGYSGPGILKKEKDFDCDSKKPKHVQMDESVREDYTPSCSSAQSVDSDPPSDYCGDDETSSRYSSDSSDRPGNKTFSNSLHNLEKELVTRREQLLARSSREPVVNLQYSGQGVNNGLITVESSSLNSPSSPSSFSGFLSAERPASVMSDSLVIPGTVSPVPGFVSRLAGSESDGNDNSVVEVELVQQPWAASDQGDIAEETLPEANDEDMVTDESDGRRSRRGNREDEEDEDDESPAEPPVTVPPKTGRNPREMLLRSFDDVLKHFREEREQERAQLAAIGVPRIKQKFTGHRNARTMIKEATFWGNDYVMSGSDCGHIFIWDRHTAELVMLLEADHHVVNCLQPHPFDPILASSGIDYDIKIWSPLRSEATFDEQKAAEIIGRNEIMLEETKDTITVPASFMIRMLTSLNQLRANRRGSRPRSVAEQGPRDQDSDIESS